MPQLDFKTAAVGNSDIANPSAGYSALFFDSLGHPFYRDSAGVTHTIGGSADVYNVLDYGLKNDGSTDNSSALNTLVQTTITTSATIYFPAGTYNIGSEIAVNVDKRIRFLGAGRGRSLIKSTSTTNHLFNISVAGFYISFEELGFGTTVTKTAGAGVVASANNAYLNVTGCEFSGMFEGTNYSSTAGNVGLIDDCQYTSPAANGSQIVVNGGSINIVVSNTTVNCTGVAGTTGVRVKQSGALQIHGSDIIGGQNCLLFDGTGTVSAVFVTNTFFDQATTGSTVKFTGTGATSRVKFVACGMTTGAAGLTAVEIAGTGTGTAIVDGIDFLNCDVYNNSFSGTTNGFLITGARGVSINGCRISGFTNGVNVTPYNGAGVTTLALGGNVIGPTENFPANGTGILLNAGAVTYGPLIIQDNNIAGNTTALSDASTFAATVQKLVGTNAGLLNGGTKVTGNNAAVTTTVETVVLSLPIPANTVKVGTTFRYTMIAHPLATTILTCRVHVGSTGTVSDASLIIMSATNLTAAGTRYLTGTTTVQVTGASATHIGAGIECTAVNIVVTGAATGATGTFNSTVANFVTVTLQNTVSTTTTVYGGVLEIIDP